MWGGEAEGEGGNVEWWKGKGWVGGVVEGEGWRGMGGEVVSPSQM